MAGASLVGVPLDRNPFARRLLVAYGLCWGWLAIAPVDRGTWLLENLLVFALAGLFAATHRRFMLSNLSIALIVAFLGLHAVGSHYTYSAVPAGDWARDTFGWSRNHYDRLVHFAFGLLWAYPLRELTLRRLHVHGLASAALPVALVVALSGVYEIIEWGAARASSPEVGIAYVGAQGDVWDGQKDMALATIGAVIAMAIAEAHRRATGHEACHRRRGRTS